METALNRRPVIGDWHDLAGLERLQDAQLVHTLEDRQTQARPDRFGPNRRALVGEYRPMARSF